MKKRILGIVLCLVMALSLVPAMSLMASAEDSITYIDRRWDEGTGKVVEEGKTLAAGKYEVVTSDTIVMVNGWYVVKENITINDRIDIIGTVNLLLCDGARLEVKDGIYMLSSRETDPINCLTVYGQANDSGELIATPFSGAGSYFAGIGFYGDGPNKGHITINGGTVTAYGGYEGAGIGGNADSSGTVTINGGIVTATSERGAAIGSGSDSSDSGTVTINGGTVTATSGMGAAIGSGIYSSGTVTINGGTVTATSERGAAIGSGIYSSDSGTVTINGGTVTATSEWGAAIGCDGALTFGDGVTFGAGADAEHITAWGDRGNAEDALGKPYFVTPYDADPEPLTYIDRRWDGEKVVESERQCIDYIVVTKNTTTLTDHKWYVVNSDVVNNHRITVDGTANLILCDGCTLTANGGIRVTAGGNFLNIYGQSDDSGMLYAKGTANNAAIGGNQYGDGGNVNIYGGTVIAHGGDDGAGIGGGSDGNGCNIFVYGGTVGGLGGSDSAGIGGGSGGNGRAINIYGGSVSARSGGTGRAIGAGYGGASDGSVTVAPYARIKGGDSAADTEMTLDEYKEHGYKFVSITARTFKYIDRSRDGEKVVEEEKYCTDYILVDKNTETFEGGKSYVVSSDVTNDHRIEVDGTANLILCDGCTLTVNGGIRVTSGNTLNIYGQVGDSGELSASGWSKNAAIGGNQYGTGGNVNICGGKVTAYGGYEGAGIGGSSGGDCGSVTVFGGSVTAIGGSDSAGIGGGCAGNGGTLSIYGGSVTAKSGGAGRAIGAGYGGDADGSVTVADHMIIKGGDNADSLTKISAIGAEKYVSVTVLDAYDLNCDGEVTEADLTLLLRHVAKIEVVTDEDLLPRLDLDGSGAVNAADVTKLAQVLKNG